MVVEVENDVPMEDGGGEVKDITFRDDDEKNSFDAWCSYERFCAQSVRFVFC